MTAGTVLITPEGAGVTMAGPAIRALELARAVARDGRGGPVTLVSLTSADRTDDDVRVVAVSGADELRAVVAGTGAVVVQGDVLGLHPWLVEEAVPIVVDAYDPYHLEQLEQAKPSGEAVRRAVVRDCVRSLSRQLARADLVLCASPRQRALWLGHLAALGRINPVTYDDAPDLGRLLAVVPFGVSGHEPPPGDRTVLQGVVPELTEEDVLLVWGGGVYEWFDPELLVRAVARVHAEFPSVRLLFLGTRHPVPGVRSATGSARAAAEETGVLGTAVFFHDGWVPYDERGRWLASADVGVSTHHRHVETEFAFRTRLLDYLWCGLPVLCTSGDDLGEEIARQGAGRTVPPGDLDALTSALADVVRDVTWRRTAAENARSLARRYVWDRSAAPLVEFCAEPRRAPDLELDAVDRLQLGLVSVGGTGAGPVTRVRAAWREGGPGLLLRRVSDRVRPRS